MGCLSIPRHQLQRIGHARKEDIAHREEGYHQQRRFGVCKPAGDGQGKETRAQQEGYHHCDDVSSAADVWDAEQVRQQSGLLPHLFSIPHIGSGGDIVTMMIPFLLGTSFLALAVSRWFTDSEAPLLMIAFFSVGYIFLSGVSYPLELMPWY